MERDLCVSLVKLAEVSNEPASQNEKVVTNQNPLPHAIDSPNTACFYHAVD
jgi:hypothetical protein